MFADTLRSQSAEILSELEPVSYGILRATQRSLEFEKTKDASIGRISSSLMVGDFVGSEGEGEEGFKDPNRLELSMRYKRRFCKDRNEMSRSFARLEVKKSESREKRREELREEREKGVKFLRRYRKGDFPDIGVTLADIVLPLQILAKVTNPYFLMEFSRKSNALLR